MLLLEEQKVSRQIIMSIGFHDSRYTLFARAPGHSAFWQRKTSNLPKIITPMTGKNTKRDWLAKYIKAICPSTIF